MVEHENLYNVLCNVNNVLHVSEFNYITPPMKNLQFGRTANSVQFSITDCALGIFAL